MHRVCDSAASKDNSRLSLSVMEPSPGRDEVGMPKGLIAELNGWPACASVNASPKALRSRRMTRGQDGSLALSCTALSSATPCRFIPALTPSPLLDLAIMLATAGKMLAIPFGFFRTVFGIPSVPEVEPT